MGSCGQLWSFGQAEPAFLREVELARYASAVKLRLDAKGLTTIMAVEIAKANIEHFKKLLETETNADKRAELKRLLAQQEQELAALLKKPNERKGG
jgi:hypothetical protein